MGPLGRCPVAPDRQLEREFAARTNLGPKNHSSVTVFLSFQSSLHRILDITKTLDPSLHNWTVSRRCGKVKAVRRIPDVGGVGDHGDDGDSPNLLICLLHIRYGRRSYP